MEIKEKVLKELKAKNNLSVVKIDTELMFKKKKGGFVRFPAKKIHTVEGLCKETISLTLAEVGKVLDEYIYGDNPPFCISEDNVEDVKKELGIQDASRSLHAK